MACRAQILVDQALEAGASAYVWKGGDAQEFLKALSSVLDGKIYLNPEANAGILGNNRRSLNHRGDSAQVSVSTRDKLLLSLVCDGPRNKEIADHLKIITKSVGAYRARLMKRLRCSSTAGMIRYAIREKIVLP